MKSVCFLFGFLFTFFLCSDVSAQSFDMRAYSRQRGFKAYQVKSSFPVQSKVNSSAPIGEKQAQYSARKEKADESEKTNKTSSDQTQEMQEYIKNNPHVQPDI